MTDAKLRALINETALLDAQIKLLQAELKPKKEAILEAVRTRQNELQPTENDGRSWRLAEADREIARVIFPAPSLKAFPCDDPKSERVHQLAGPHFTKLFDDQLLYRPVKAFRQVAEALLAKKAGKLIELCETPTAPRLSFGE